MYPIVDARVGMRVAHRGSRFSGTVESVRSNEVSIAGNTGLVRQFPLEPGAFVVDGAPVTLRRRAIEHHGGTPNRVGFGGRSRCPSPNRSRVAHRRGRHP